MRVSLDHAGFCRDHWSLSATGTFPEGIHLISGEIGSGKSTLALLLAGLLTPSSGSIVREGIQSLMVSFQFPEYHITGSTLTEECRSWGADPGSLLAETGLAGRGDLPPTSLSRGELKRLHLACVLSRKDDLLILDEPFSSLDCREKARMCDQLSRRGSGITILFTHEQEFFPRVDWIWEIRDGILLCRGQIPDALDSWSHAPEIIRDLIASGKRPDNITRSDILEAACRT